MYEHETSSFPNLKRLWLASYTLRAFPDFLKYKSSLKFLDLSSNQISGPIPNWICSFDYMVILNVSHNFLTDFEGPIQNLSSNLLKLDLHSNHIQGHAPTSFKNAIYLDYSSNRFISINLKRNWQSHPFFIFFSLFQIIILMEQSMNPFVTFQVLEHLIFLIIASMTPYQFV
ncbi:putative non-specific serine/threonine protein kinase [Medicago truncatula]|uniref:Putative non-specific serine/threonine protein kinase n=1 Tax=Medicago truncatula TaxID=3880 RepID=A0A396J7E6_MEDTR|nr:putative non-specific serine/threonine protein kinase [Medicago truncatula]